MLGTTMPPPELQSVAIVGTWAVMRGRNFCEITWIEVLDERDPPKDVLNVLTIPREDGAITVDIRGIKLPSGPIWVRPHTPWGGPGPRFLVDLAR